MAFQSGLILEADAVPDYWIVAAPLIWHDELFGLIEVPVGFRTDLASIGPLDRNGCSRRPAALHDWNYAWRGIGKDNADLLFKASLLAEGMPLAEAVAYYLGVRSHWGLEAWDNDQGALDTRDFDTPEHYKAWVDTLTLRSVGPEVPNTPPAV